MGFLTKLLATITPIFLNFIWEKVAKLIADWKISREAKKKRESDNKQVREKTDAAQTPEERDEALKNELRNS